MSDQEADQLREQFPGWLIGRHPDTAQLMAWLPGASDPAGGLLVIYGQTADELRHAIERERPKG